MPKLDKLKIEADILKGYLFYFLGAVLASVTGSIGVAIELFKNKHGGYIILLFAVMLILLKISATIFLKIRKSLNTILDDIEKEQ